MDKLLAIARLINDLTDAELSTIDCDASWVALVGAMQELTGHPEIDEALERLIGMRSCQCWPAATLQ